MKNQKLKLAGAASAMFFCLSSLAGARADAPVIETTRVATDCSMFNIDANAAGITAGARARIVQARLDNALIKARDRTPSSVRVEILNRNPVVTLNHALIVTADGNSAARNRISQMELAQRWADSIRLCLADQAKLNQYISMLTGSYKQTIVQTLPREEIAVATQDTLFPIKLSTPILTDVLGFGERVEAVVSQDVPLLPNYTSYLPAGSIARGQVVPADPYIPNNCAGRHAFTVNFYEFHTPDGRTIPINGHILGGINQWKMIHVHPVVAECCNGTSLPNSLPAVEVFPTKGHVIGSWTGKPLDEVPGPDKTLSRAIFGRNTGIAIAAGEPMLLQLSGVTSMALGGKPVFVSNVTNSISSLTETH